MTVISKSTLDVLKNFCSINKSIVIKPGNQISTLSINKNILAIAEVEESFDSQISIYDLGVFLGGLSLFDARKIDTTQTNYITVSSQNGRFKTRFFYADPDIITQPPEKEISLPSEDVKFFLESEVFRKISIAAQQYNLNDLCLYGHDGEMRLQVVDKKNDTSNSFSVDLGPTDNEFCFCFKIENLRLISGMDYNVTVSKNGVALFQGDGIKYFIATEPNN